MSPAWLFIAPVFLLTALFVAEATRTVLRGRSSPWVGSPLVALLLIVVIGVGCLQLGKAVNGPLRVSLEALEFAPTGDQSVSVGGSRLNDELFVDRTPENLLVFTRDESGDVLVQRGEVRRDEPPIIALVNGVPVGSREIADGGRICVSACSTRNPINVQYDSVRDALVSERGQPGASFQGSANLARLGPLAAQFEVYALRTHLPEAGETAAPAKSIFLREGERLYWLPLDAGLVGEENVELLSVRLCSAEDDCLRAGRVQLYAVDLLASSGRRIAERRSFQVSMESSNTLRIVLDTPWTRSLSHEDLALERSRLRQLNLEPTFTLAAGAERPWANAISSLGIDVLGGSYSSTAYDIYFSRTPVEVGVQRSIVRVPNGHTVALGGDLRAIMRVTELNGTWPVIGAAQWLILLACVSSFLATIRLRIESTAAFALFALLEFLLVLRVLTSIEAVYFDAGRQAAGTPALALVTLVLGPLVLSLFSRTTLETPARLMAHTAFVGLSALWVIRNVGPISQELLWLTAATVVLAVTLALIGLIGRFLKNSLINHALGLWAIFDRVIDRRGNKPLLLWLFAAGALAAVRYVIGSFGVQERASEGDLNFALSIIYVPVAAWLFAYFFTRWDAGARDSEPARSSAAFLVGLGLVYVVAPVAVRDWGSAIYGLPVLVWAVLQAGAPEPIHGARLRWPRPRWRHWLAAPAIAASLAALMLVGAGLSIDSNYDRVRSDSVEESRQALVDLTQTEGTWLRVWSWIAPRATTGTGTRATDEVAQTMANVVDHSRAMVGPGYLLSDPPLGLLPFHMNDNVSAVHLFGPFGRLGAAAFVLLLFASLALVVTVIRRGAEGDGLPLRNHLTVLCLGTIVFVSTYMVMAHSFGAPLTGRNVYLLSVASGGDFVEGIVLFSLALACVLPEGDRDDG